MHFKFKDYEQHKQQNYAILKKCQSLITQCCLYELF